MPSHFLFSSNLSKTLAKLSNISVQETALEYWSQHLWYLKRSFSLLILITTCLRIQSAPSWWRGPAGPNGIMRQDSSFLIAGMESQRCLSHSWFLPEAQNAKFGVFSHDRIIYRRGKNIIPIWGGYIWCPIRKLAPNHVSVIFGSEGRQSRVCLKVIKCQKSVDGWELGGCHSISLEGVSSAKPQ